MNNRIKNTIKIIPEKWEIRLRSQMKIRFGFLITVDAALINLYKDITFDLLLQERDKVTF